MQVVLRLVGAFYAFAGFLVARATLTSRFLDRAIAAIAAQKPNMAETVRAIWLLTQSFVILAGGAALILLLYASVWLFAAAAVGQAAYLFHIAPRYLDAEDPPNPQGRRQSQNAFVIYLAATCLVVWAALTERLVGLNDVPWQLLVLFSTVVVGYSAATTWRFARPFKPARGAFSASAGDTDVEQPHPSTSRRVKVMADHDAHPLWAMDDGLYGDFAPEEIGLSNELSIDLMQWAEEFSNSLNRDDPATSRWNEAQVAAHEQSGRKLAVRLARERPDRMVYYHARAHGAVEVHPTDMT